MPAWKEAEPAAYTSVGAEHERERPGNLQAKEGSLRRKHKRFFSRSYPNTTARHLSHNRSYRVIRYWRNVFILKPYLRDTYQKGTLKMLRMPRLANMKTLHFPQSFGWSTIGNVFMLKTHFPHRYLCSSMCVQLTMANVTEV